MQLSDQYGNYFTELPEGYVKCSDINTFLNVDLRNQLYTRINGFKYILFTLGKYYTYETFVYESEAINKAIITKTCEYINKGLIFVPRIPIFIILQANTDIPEELFKKRFPAFLKKAKDEKKLVISETERAYDYKFDYLIYTIHVFNKTGKSKLIFDVGRSRDSTMYVIEHILSGVKC